MNHITKKCRYCGNTCHQSTNKWQCWRAGLKAGERLVRQWARTERINRQAEAAEDANLEAWYQELERDGIEAWLERVSQEFAEERREQGDFR